MKKLSILSLSIFLLFLGVVNAKNIETENRTEENRYGIPERFEVGEIQKRHALMTPYVDANLKVYDFASLLSIEEEQKLHEEMESKFKNEDYDVVIVTIPNVDSGFPKEYAEDFYDYNDFKSDGIILLISLESRDIYIATSGYGQILFDQSRTEHMVDKITPSLSNGEYLKAMRLFLEEVESASKKGPSKAMKSCEIINSYGDYRCKKQVPIFWILPFSLSLIIFGFLPFFCCGILTSYFCNFSIFLVTIVLAVFIIWLVYTIIDSEDIRPKK